MKLALWVFVLLLAATTVYAGDTLGPSVVVLRDAVGTRSDALDALPTPTKPEKKEAKKLRKAEAILEAYTGADDKAELKKLAKAVKRIVKSKTADSTILASLEGLLASFVTFANQNEGLVLDLLDDLVTEKYRKKIQKLLAKAEAVLAKGENLIPAVPDKACKNLAKAVIDYLKAIAKAQNYGLRDNGGGGGDDLPAGVTFENLGAMLVNQSGKFLYVKDVSVDLRVLHPDGKEYGAKGNASSLDPTWVGIPEFPFTLHGAGGTYDWVWSIAPELMDAGAPPIGPGVRVVGSVTYRFEMDHKTYTYVGRWDQTL